MGRKEQPDLPKGEALRKAVEEYCLIYDIGLTDKSAKTTKAAKEAEDEIFPEIEISIGAVSDAVAVAVREAVDQARTAKKVGEEVRKEAERAMHSVLQVAE